MILTIPNFDTKNKSGSKISSSKNDILQDIRQVFTYEGGILCLERWNTNY